MESGNRDCSMVNYNTGLKNETTPIVPPPLSASHRTISVHAEGEVQCPPDTFTLTITITSTKEKLDEAQSSVKRRSDYILQVLRNHGYRDNNTQIFQEITRDDESYQSKCIIIIEGRDIKKCIEVRNVLLEKMDSSVKCGHIYCQHSHKHKANMREAAFKTAVSLAKSKAQSVSQSLGVQLGPVLTLVEEKLLEDSPDEKYDDKSDSVEKSSADMKRMMEATVIYISVISAVFEVIPLKKSPRKNHKHLQ